MTDASSLRREAEQILRHGQTEAAIQAYQRLLRLMPDGALDWYNLGYLQRMSRQFEEAVSSYRIAIARGIERPEEVRLNIAVILSEHLNDVTAAKAELQVALAENRSFIPGLLNLGNLCEDIGDADGARAAYARVLLISPHNGRAISRLAAIEVFEGNGASALPGLRSALAQVPATSNDAAEISFAMGQALDASGDYDGAFEAFEQANRIARAVADPRRFYDRTRHEGLIESIVRAWPGPGADLPQEGDASPLFILGLFRSGSTLAEGILCRHSLVTSGGELDLLPALVADKLQPFPFAAASAPKDLLERIRSAYLGGIRHLFPDAGLLTDKRPDNFLYVGLIKSLFPDARIVHSVRTPLDNILSIFFLHFDESQSHAFALEDIAHWYVQYRRLMTHWQSIHPGEIFDFNYDRVVQDARSEVARLLRFCDLPWEESCLSEGVGTTPVRTPSAWQVRKPLHARSSGRWRNYGKHLGQARAILEQAGFDS